MCGIFGYVSRSPQIGGTAWLTSAIAALRHRGPDDSGRFESADEDLRCGLAHTRLSILDLSSAGHQPMSSHAGRYTLVYNGEVYNHRQLRSDLESRGVVFHSSCDTEVVLQAYIHWGRDCVVRFRGMFAFAIWDAKERNLFVARDRLGIKPLYLVQTSECFAFSSEVRAFVAARVIDRRIDPEALPGYFAFGSVIEPRTIFSGVSMLPPGTVGDYHDGKFDTRRYWELPLETEPDLTVRRAVEEVGAELREAVRLRLVADVPIGVFLSGGIDSSAIVQLASESAQSVHTFTVTFDESEFSEAKFAAEVARRYRTNHHQVHLRATMAAAQIDKAVAALDQPSADGVNTYFVAKASKEAGLSVALSGLGGDEVFAGYTHFRHFGAMLKAARTIEMAPPMLGSALKAMSLSPLLTGRAQKFSNVLAAGSKPSAIYAALRQMFSVEQRNALRSNKRALSVDAFLPDGFEREFSKHEIDSINAYSALELTNYLRNTLLRDADVMSMASGLELRVPFLDHILVERVMRVPGWIKIHGPGNKPLLTQAVSGIPNDATHRPKMGFTLPFDAWFRGPLRHWIEQRILGSAIDRLSFLDPQGARNVWTEFLQGKLTHSRLWCLVALLAWCEANEVSV